MTKKIPASHWSPPGGREPEKRILEDHQRRYITRLPTRLDTFGEPPLAESIAEQNILLGDRQLRLRVTKVERADERYTAGVFTGVRLPQKLICDNASADHAIPSRALFHLFV